MKKIFVIILFLFLFFIISSEKEDNENDMLFDFDIGNKLEINFIKNGELYIINKNDLKKIDVEIAVDKIQINNGLSYRSSLKENRGMLFILNNEEDIKNLNMDNIRIPLDIIYINQNYVVSFIKKNVFPMEEIILNKELNNIKYILEINSGLCDKFGIKLNKTKFLLKTIKN
ncbi:DUF192 domain-containing protein [Blattabacterium cuenoti]|uniref:DUF192 domain-containing protein n=1 Tax=Blattabacterium cuenoti TaxID=1653831 RepID=UPI00163C5A14|nr:DUF192 domain-containing protein [Blattabacterium cuenoti]